MRVALIRHPRPLVPAGTCYGRLDIPEHPDAAAQVAAAVVAVRSFRPAALWSSPALRCQGMARALAASLDTPLRHDARLLEMDFGAWEGMLWDNVPRDALDRWAGDPWGFAAPGGESGLELVARVSAFHDAIVEHASDCVIVTHGGPLKILRALRMGTEVDLMAPSMALGAVELT
jgi:alpha-ribazole phosphatase